MSLNKPIRETFSLCPVCRRRIPAVVVEKNGSVFMEKACPEHGPFCPLIAKYAHYYRDLMNFYRLLQKHFPYRREVIESCAFTTTLDCNLKCPICFTADENRVMPPAAPLSEIGKNLKIIRGKGINVMLTGGEPTVRKDLPEIVRLIRETGNFPVMVTNASRLENLEYLRTLKENGLYAIAPWFDTPGDDQTYQRMRGQPLAGQRRQVLQNMRKLGLKLIIFFVCVKGVNEDQLPGILKMTQEYPELFKIIVLGYMHRGAKGFSEENEYATDELWEAVAKASGVFSSLNDLYLAIKVNFANRALRHIYHCYNSHFVLMPRSGRKEDGFDPELWSRGLGRFEELLPESPGRARFYFLRKFGAELVRKGFLKPLAERFLLRRRELADLFIPPDYYWLRFQYLYYPRNYDEEMVRNFCSNYSLNPGLEKRVSFCEFCNLDLKT